MARQKLVYPTNEVPHLWAHKTQDEARNAQGNLYFRYETIYSYGSHFPIARHATNKRKEKAILYTTRTYGPITAKHLSQVSCAIPSGVTVFHVQDVQRGSYGGDLQKDDHNTNLTAMVNSASEAWKKAQRARANKQYLLAESQRWIEQANAYSKFFGLRKQFKNIDPAELERQKEAAKRANAKAIKEMNEREAKRQAELEAERAEKLPELRSWQKGEEVYLPHCFRSAGEAYLRVSHNQDEEGLELQLETSLGARIPLEHATKLLPFLRRGVAYEHNGHSIHLGHYRVDEIDTEGNLKAGCHYVKREEIERLAATLGL